MIKLFYDRDAPPLSDFLVEHTYELILEAYKDGKHQTIFCSTSPLYDRVRLGVAMNEIESEDIVFRFGDQDVYVNEYGAILDWPDGFCDIGGNLAEAILKASWQKRKARRKN